LKRLESIKVEHHRKTDIIHMLVHDINEFSSKNQCSDQDITTTVTQKQHTLCKGDKFKQSLSQLRDELVLVEAQVIQARESVRQRDDRITVTILEQ